ncbi:MAG TPA: UDP-N-acetylglucosamine--N-acetylmuramyl-(pentapeptide) pyrophosphoryl-undecaprenol N-acetylglucosamine transferase, partial [Bellilinea sp.]|nr:UDP-N-acetylglucosamine--N-acetylmuramyl-(pentapeptide) pyrophosphoryl-undecaprenol N-acetylglucosamine transferase [Bellilinea sp.]
HISGETDWDTVSNAPLSLPEELRSNYHPFPYLHEDIGAALAAADLVISRSGASTLGEYPHFGLPAILVPYPFAWKYQTQNAEFLKSNGAALIIENEALDRELIPMVNALLNDPQKLREMSAAMKALDKPNAAGRIADLLLQLAGGQKRT